MNTWEWIQEHGLLVTLLIGGVLVGIVFLKKQPQVATSTASPADLSGLTTDASGHPIVYRAVSDTFVTENISGSYNAATSAANAPASIGSTSVGTTTGSTTTTTTTDNHSSPIEHPIEPAPQPAKTITTGLLGPNVAVDFGKRTYKSPTSPISLPIPIPAGDRLIQGSFNRVWYMDGSTQHLLTSGVGGPIEAIP